MLQQITIIQVACNACMLTTNVNHLPINADIVVAAITPQKSTTSIVGER